MPSLQFRSPKQFGCFAARMCKHKSKNNAGKPNP